MTNIRKRVKTRIIINITIAKITLLLYFKLTNEYFRGVQSTTPCLKSDPILQEGRNCF